MKHPPFLRSFIYKVSFAQMNETEDYAQLRGSPGLCSSSAPARVICAVFFPEESLWTISEMPNRRELMGERGVVYKASGNASKHS